MSPDPETTRRTLLKTAGAVGAGGLLAGCVGSATDAESTTTTEPAATEPTPTTNASETVTVRVGPDGENVFAPDDVTVSPGTTVRFVWESDAHNVAPTSQPDGADWTGHEDLESEGFEYEHTFETLGTYRYECVPHTTLGMTGVVRVREGGTGTRLTSRRQTSRRLANRRPPGRSKPTASKSAASSTTSRRARSDP